MQDCVPNFWQPNWQPLLTPLKEKPRQPSHRVGGESGSITTFMVTGFRFAHEQIRLPNQTTSSFNNIVCLVAKYFQLVKFSQVLLLQNPRQPKLTGFTETKIIKVLLRLSFKQASKGSSPTNPASLGRLSVASVASAAMLIPAS
jgi:hypothetical protein